MVNFNSLVVEFSVKQQAFHKETIADMLNNNIQNILSKKEVDYIPIGFFDSHEDADKFIKASYDIFKKSETDLQQDAAIEFFKPLHLLLLIRF